MLAYKLYAIVFVYSNHTWADASVVIALSISAILLDHCWSNDLQFNNQKP